MKDGVGVGEQPEPERADDEAGEQVAQHRAEPEPLEQRHGDDAGGEKGDDLDELARGSGRFGGHADKLSNEGGTRRGAGADKTWTGARASSARPPVAQG
ncbi:hypothetical protein JCM2811A_29540 [Methylorubrum rhodinum]